MKTIFSISFIFLFLLSSYAQNNISDENFNKAKRLFEKKDYDNALREINEAVYWHESDSVYYFKALIIFMQKPFNRREIQKEKNEAIISLYKAIELNPLYKEAYYLKAKIYSEYFIISEGYNKVFVNLNKAIDLDPNYIDALKLRGWIFIQSSHTFSNPKQSYEKALNDFNAIIRLESKNCFALKKRAECYDFLGFYDKAIKDREYLKKIECE